MSVHNHISVCFPVWCTTISAPILGSTSIPFCTSNPVLKQPRYNTLSAKFAFLKFSLKNPKVKNVFVYSSTCQEEKKWGLSKYKGEEKKVKVTVHDLKFSHFTVSMILKDSERICKAVKDSTPM